MYETATERALETGGGEEEKSDLTFCFKLSLIYD